MAKTVMEMVAEAKTRIENLTPEQVASEIEREGVVLVDLREPAEREQNGTIAGSVHAPRGMLEFHADSTTPYHKPEFDPKARVILFCASSGRSALGVLALRELGYGNVAHLEGGFKAWSEAGRPVEGAGA